MYFTSDPIPELEHVLLVDPEVLDLRPVGAECDEVQSNVTGLLSALQKPHLGRGRVRDGFLDSYIHDLLSSGNLSIFRQSIFSCQFVYQIVITDQTFHWSFCF